MTTDPAPSDVSPDPPRSEPSPEPARPVSPAEWEAWDDERLLDVRMCDLGLRIGAAGWSPASRSSARAAATRDLRFRPHFWLSDEWFTPDGVPGIADPLLPRAPAPGAARADQMLEVEGGTPDWCMRILRHEVGHAIDNAYRLRRCARAAASSSAAPPSRTPSTTRPKPYSKSFVLHLDSWYAQSHPDEDFAETFAVWLTPGSRLAPALRAAGRRCRSSSTSTS